MTVRELLRELKRYPADAEVFVVKDWEKYDEMGALNDIYHVRSVSDQVHVVDTGLDFEDEREILLEIDSDPAD